MNEKVTERDMSQQSTVLQMNKQAINSGDNGRWISDDRIDPVVFVGFTALQCVKKSIYRLLIVSCLTTGQVRAESSEILSGYPGHISLSIPAVITEGIKNQEQFISDGIELFPLIPVLGKPVSDPGANTKRTNRPDERNEGRIGVEQKNKLTPDDSHKFWRLLSIQLSAFLVVFPVGAYLSMRTNLRRDWRKHIPKGGRLKVPVLGMISILCIPRCIKSNRWQIWEQRQWFMDMKVRYGVVVAYRDAWHWKKIIAEKW